MSVKKVILGALLAPTLLLASNAYAGTVSIVAKPIIIDDSALPNVRGLAEVQSLPLFTKMVEVPQERSLEDVSLAELSLVGTSPQGSSSTTVSAPVVASYNSPPNTGSLPSSLIHNNFNNTSAPSSGTTTIANNYNTNTQIIKDLRHEGLGGNEMVAYNPAFENMLIEGGGHNSIIKVANTNSNGKIVKVVPPKQILMDY